MLDQIHWLPHFQLNPGEMSTSKQLLIKALKQHYSQTMTRAAELRTLAAAQLTKEEANRYFRKARLEGAKAKRYLKHADTLADLDV